MNGCTRHQIINFIVHLHSLLLELAHIRAVIAVVSPIVQVLGDRMSRYAYTWREQTDLEYP